MGLDSKTYLLIPEALRQSVREPFVQIAVLFPLIHQTTLRRVHTGNSNGTIRSEQQKRAAVIDLCARSDSARSVAQKVGVSRQTLYDWKNQKLGHDVPASMTRRRELPPAASGAKNFIWLSPVCFTQKMAVIGVKTMTGNEIQL